MKKYLAYFVFLALFYTSPAFATAYFAVGTGNWSGSSAVWSTSSGGSAALVTPTSADTCTFDLHSTGTVTVTGTSGSPDNCGTVTMTAPGAGTLIMGSTAQLNVAGSWNGASGLTFAPNATSVINFTSTTAAVTFTGGSYSYGAVTDTTLTTGAFTLADATTFQTLTLSTAGVTKTTTSGYKFSADQTVTGTFTAAGNSLILRDFLYSSTIGTPRTISAGTFAITNTDLRDITKAGAGSGNISATSATTGNGDCGGNTGWTFQGARNVYMKTAVSVNWSAANWFTASGGSTAAVPPLPLCHDTAVFDANSVTAGSKIITLDEARLPSTDWTGVLNTPAFATSTAYDMYGSLTLVSGMTHTGAATTSLMGRGSNTLDGGTLTWPAGSTLEPNCGTGTYTLARNFTMGSGSALWNSGTHSGTFALGGFNFTTSGAAAMTIDAGTLSGTGAITLGTGTLTISGGTLSLGGTLTTGAAGISMSSGALTMNGNNATGYSTYTQSGGTLSLSGQMNGSSGITIGGGTITDAGASGELKGTSLAFNAPGTYALRKATMTSTIALSGGAVVTFNPGTFTHVGNLSVASASSTSLTINGTAVDTAGVMTVTAAAAAATTGYAWSQ